MFEFLLAVEEGLFGVLHDVPFFNEDLSDYDLFVGGKVLEELEVAVDVLVEELVVVE